MEIGVDITSIKRFENVSEHFIKRILTDIEYKEFINLELNKKASFLATHWATKEAIFKATQDKNYLLYTLLHDENGKPFILDHEELKVSISHEDDTCIAFVIKTK